MRLIAALLLILFFCQNISATAAVKTDKVKNLFADDLTKLVATIDDKTVRVKQSGKVGLDAIGIIADRERTAGGMNLKSFFISYNHPKGLKAKPDVITLKDKNNVNGRITHITNNCLLVDENGQNLTEIPFNKIDCINSIRARRLSISDNRNLDELENLFGRRDTIKEIDAEIDCPQTEFQSKDFKTVIEMLEKVAQKGVPLIVAQEDFDGEVLATLVVNKLDKVKKPVKEKKPGGNNNQPGSRYKWILNLTGIPSQPETPEKIKEREKKLNKYISDVVTKWARSQKAGEKEFIVEPLPDWFYAIREKSLNRPPRVIRDPQEIARYLRRILEIDARRLGGNPLKLVKEPFWLNNAEFPKEEQLPFDYLNKLVEETLAKITKDDIFINSKPPSWFKNADQHREISTPEELGDCVNSLLSDLTDKRVDQIGSTSSSEFKSFLNYDISSDEAMKLINSENSFTNNENPASEPSDLTPGLEDNRLPNDYGCWVNEWNLSDLRVPIAATTNPTDPGVETSGEKLLKDAQDEGLCKVELTNETGSNTAVNTLMITNLVPRTLFLIKPQFMFFKPDKPSLQWMINIFDPLIKVQPKATKSLEIETMCVSTKLEKPPQPKSSGVNWKIADYPDKKVAATIIRIIQTAQTLEKDGKFEKVSINNERRWKKISQMALWRYLGARTERKNDDLTVDSIWEDFLSALNKKKKSELTDAQRKKVGALVNELDNAIELTLKKAGAK